MSEITAIHIAFLAGALMAGTILGWIVRGNRTAGEIRHLFSKYGGNLGTSGSVSYLFKQSGIICFPPESTEDKIMQVALDAGALNILDNDDGSIEVTTAWEELTVVKESMIAAGFEPETADVIQQAATSVDLQLEDAEKVMRLIDMLEDLDDVQSVHTNADFSEEVMAQL